MKKYFTLMLFTASFIAATAQTKLHSLMLGENGLSKHFTILSPEQRVHFNSNQLKNLIELNLNADLKLINADSDNIGYTHYRYRQTYKGYPVENSMLIINVKNGTVYNLVGSIVLNFDTQMDNQKELLSKEQSINAALKYVNAKKYAWQDQDFERALKKQENNPKATNYPIAIKVWYNAGNEIDPAKLRLAYKIDIYSLKPFDRKFVFVDVENGNILGTETEIEKTDATGTANTEYANSRTIHSDLISGIYKLHDIVKGNGIFTYHGESGLKGNDYTSTTADWTLLSQDQHAMDVHWGLEQTYRFYKNIFNRNSYDNMGGAINSYVNDPNFIDNAQWDGSAMHFGIFSSLFATLQGNGVTSIDVTGHELTHGVTQIESGLIYQDEEGSINESLSDIMGKCIQFYARSGDINWQIGNDMNVVFRDMSNPNNPVVLSYYQPQQPDTYNGTYWYAGTDQSLLVHTNSGVGNFMFYLLVNGGSGRNDLNHCYDVTGIGIDEAEQIIYRTETSYLFPTSQYSDWRTACINAATDLYGSNSNEVVAVKNAWYAVGLGSPVYNSVSVTGANIFCSGSQTYNINGLYFGATVTWHLSGPVVGGYSYQLPLQNVCTLSTNGNQATLTKTGNGNVHLQATITNCDGVIQSAGEDITLGTPQVSYNGAYTKTTGATPIVGTVNTTNATTSYVAMAFPSNNQYSFTETSAVNATWQNTGSGTMNFTFNPANNNSHINFNITTTNSCGTHTDPVAFYYSSTPSFTIIPNPANNLITVSVNESLQKNQLANGTIKQIKVVDKLGNVKLTSNYNANEKPVIINTSGLPSNTYFLHIYDGKQWSIQQILILH